MINILQVLLKLVFLFQGKGGDVASLVDRLMGPLYHNYRQTRTVLVRQARDLLVCEYLGNLQRFETEFCLPAASLLRGVQENIKVSNFDSSLFRTQCSAVKKLIFVQNQISHVKDVSDDIGYNINNFK